MLNQNLSPKPLYTIGIVAIIVGLLVTLLMRLELQAPGIQVFSDPAVYNTMVRLHGDVFIYHAFVGLLFGALGYSLLPSRISDQMMLGQNGVRVIAGLWAMSIVLLGLSMIPFAGGAAAVSDGWTIYRPLSDPLVPTTQNGSVFIVLAARLFTFAATIFTACVLVFSCLAAIGKAERFWSQSPYIWSIICSGVLLIVYASMSLFHDLFPNSGATFFDPAQSQRSKWQLDINSIMLVLAAGLLCVACEGVLKRSLIAPGIASAAIILFSAVSLSGGPLYWVQTVFQTSSDGLIYALAMFPQFLLGLVQFVCLISIVFLAVHKRGVLFWIICAFVPAIVAVVIGTNQVTFGYSSAFRDTMYVVGQEHILVSSLVIICPIAAIYAEFSAFRKNQSVKPFWSYTTLLMVGVGLCAAHIPQLFLGLQGMPRRYIDYPNVFSTWNFVSSIGAYIIIAAIVPFVISLWKTNPETSEAEEVFG